MNSLTSILRRQRQLPALPRVYGAQRIPPSAMVRHYATVRKEHTTTSKTINFILGTGIVVGGLVGISYGFDSRASIHKYVLVPLMHWTMDPETAHKAGIKLLSMGISPWDTQHDDPTLEVKLWNKTFSNPVGIAAGFDKHAEAIDGLFDLGFGYVEVGSVTPEPQPGNPQPRMFRLPEDKCVINRYGFNSEGHKAVETRLRQRIKRFLYKHAQSFVDHLSTNRSLRDDRILAVNLGKNKASTPESVEDYVLGVERLGHYADVLVVNVSSPNTPGLRSLQRKDMLEDLLRQVISARDRLQSAYKPPLLVKIAPDLSEEELKDVSEAALSTKVDGIIISNTTISRPSTLINKENAKEVGGLSGPVVKPLALRALRQVYKHTGGKIPLVGCGGISTGEDALEYARAGASMVQLYSSMAYEGPGIARAVKDGIVKGLNGRKWMDIVGEDTKKAGN
ncbi:Dihydroorotate dehydrogenase-domain-containing protein [Gamsiella multidivaricata]|uniref:Dihydroorotate dehydrogenase-domain-containing protein n=1 Tax=Gamsiella multidivaricata TaxID=101098 RepID=UPI00221F1727|nr:Dihydroorotate dehydrogenase-domain-containing protein [Gamsiella multidivaricata]KAI7817295.1 Dihydroorotate dehydrogenase-domain-containing protein [Gamsiella multidivaricata]